MAGFSRDALVEKLHKLVPTMESIQSLAMWFGFHRKRADQCVTIWDEELRKVDEARKLSFLYLGNDIIQTSRKKGPELTDAFRRVLPGAFAHVERHGNDKARKEMRRMIAIWRERHVYETNFLQDLERALAKQGASGSERDGPSGTSSAPTSDGTARGGDGGEGSGDDEAGNEDTPIDVGELPEPPAHPIVPLLASIRKRALAEEFVLERIADAPKDAWELSDALASAEKCRVKDDDVRAAYFAHEAMRMYARSMVEMHREALKELATLQRELSAKLADVEHKERAAAETVEKLRNAKGTLDATHRGLPPLPAVREPGRVSVPALPQPRKRARFASARGASPPTSPPPVVRQQRAPAAVATAPQYHAPPPGAAPLDPRVYAGAAASDPRVPQRAPPAAAAPPNPALPPLQDALADPAILAILQQTLQASTEAAPPGVPPVSRPDPFGRKRR